MAGGPTQRAIALGHVALVGIVLASCGKAPHESRPAWRDAEELACLRSGAVHESAYVVRGPAINGPGSCGALAPFSVAALSDGKVPLTLPGSHHGRNVYAVKLTCAMVPALETWMQSVQRAAAAVYGQPVVEVHTLGSYSCRRMNNGSNTRHISEHAYADAIDMSGFTLADGREVMVRSGWRGSPEDQEFLRSVFVGSCEVFHTVLGPGSDGHHEDHFHLDLMRHGHDRHICRPVIKFTPRTAAPLPTPVQPPVPPGQLREEPESDDPYAMDEGAPPNAVAMAEPRAAPISTPRRPVAVATLPPAGPGFSRPAPARTARADDGEPADSPVLPVGSRGDRLDRRGSGREGRPPAPSREARASEYPKSADRIDEAPAQVRRQAAENIPPRRRPAAETPPGWTVGPQPLTPPQRIGPALPEGDGQED